MYQFIFFVLVVDLQALAIRIHLYKIMNTEHQSGAKGDEAAKDEQLVDLVAANMDHISEKA